MSRSCRPDLDIVIHCAGDVSFDPPIHEAFETNVLGTERLLRQILATGGKPHYVHVSTAYTAGRRRGAIPEASVEHEVDWRTEARCRDWRCATGSRRPPGRRACCPASQGSRDANTGGPVPDHRGPGRRTAAQGVGRQEARRRPAASAPARSAGPTSTPSPRRWASGWSRRSPRRSRSSILRPSIIESALQIPHPGWIEGFKMAEPLILAYGRGELPEFPASPGRGRRHRSGRPRCRRDTAAAAALPEPGQPDLPPRIVRRA